MGPYNSVLLASSGAANSSVSKGKQFVKLSTDHSETTKTPLCGVNIDILHYKEFCPEGKVIESSKYENSLKSKKQILSEIQSQFWSKISICDNFYFTGHGYFDGAMVIQTKENPEGQPFLIEELYDIWNQKKNGYNKGWLNIYLDCSYAGKMAVRLKNNRTFRQGQSATIYCSSGPNDVSLYMEKYGGTLIAKQWAIKNPEYLLSHQEKILKQKFKSTFPVQKTYHKDTWEQLKAFEWK